MIDAKSAFGILADGSDETAKINAAFAAANTAKEKLHFGPGTYGWAGTAPIDVCCDFEGEGEQSTIFKNLSDNVRFFDFRPASPGNLGSAFRKGSGFMIDQNGRTKSAIRLNTQFNKLHDVWIKDHKSGPQGEYALHLTNATLADLQNVHISNSDNCMAMVDSYYVNGRNMMIERQNGRALMAQNCAQTHFTGLYLDNGNPSSVGQTVPEVMLINGCSSFVVSGFSAELANSGSLMNNVFEPGQGDCKAYFLCKDSFNVSLTGVRVFHSAGSPPAYLFYSKDGSMFLTDNEWHEDTVNTIYAGCSSNNKQLSVVNMTTHYSASGSKYGVAAFYGTPQSLTVKNWKHRAGVVTHHFGNAVSVHAEQV